MKQSIDVWQVIQVCLAVSAVLLIPAVIGIAKIWNKGNETAAKVDSIVLQMASSDLKRDAQMASMSLKIDALAKELSHMSGMLQGKFGMGGDSASHT